MPLKSIEKVLNEHSTRLMAQNGVEGIGQGESEGSPCITVFVSRPKEEFRDLIPDSIEGYKVVISESGTFFAF